MIKTKTKETPKLDVTEYVGDNSEIETAEFRDAKHGRILYIESAVIPLKEGDELPEGKELRASNMLSISFDEEAKEYYIGIDSKADKFLKAKGLDVEKDVPEGAELGKTVKKLVGMKIKVQKKDSGFLEIA